MPGERPNLTFFCDDARHMVCQPYSLENLHKMADYLGLGRWWFHPGNWPHYDMPVGRIKELTGYCVVLSTREIINICKEATNGP